MLPSARRFRFQLMPLSLMRMFGNPFVQFGLRLIDGRARRAGVEGHRAIGLDRHVDPELLGLGDEAGEGRLALATLLRLLEGLRRIWRLRWQLGGGPAGPAGGKDAPL